MNEHDRLQELERYKIVDTPSERELDELVEIASAICGTPISLITFLDENRQWLKARKGVDVALVPRDTSFCQHLLHTPKSLLVVEDPLNDERFKNNPLVQGNPHIRFYAGAPLESSNGHVIGSLCVIDNETHHINEDQKKALMLLAKKVMDYLETRNKLLEQSNSIEFNAARLKKLTDYVPGAIYQLEMKPTGEMSFSFISKGIEALHPGLTPANLTENADMIFQIIHKDDLQTVQKSIQQSFLNLTAWDIEYRVIGNNNKIKWFWANANPERKSNGTVVWYGNFEDITERKEYIKGLEGILFDISHVMRKPVTTMMGLTTAIQIKDIDTDRLQKCVEYIKAVAIEMDDYTRKLTEKYFELSLNFRRKVPSYTAQGIKP